MKITNEGVIQIIETPRYHYLQYESGKLMPSSIKFTAEFLQGSNVGGLPFIEWLEKVISNKVLVASDQYPILDISDSIQMLSPFEDPYLVVKSLDKTQITNTIFTIVNSLLDDSSKLKSLEWNN